jgi:hypothetical protein
MAPPASHKSPQISNLRAVTAYLTGHNDDTKAIVQETRPADWSAYEGNQMAFNVIYTTSQFPAQLTADADIATHKSVVGEPGKLGLVNKNGTVCRIVDFAPGYECMMHRTKSLDYGVVLEGEILLVLDAEEQAPQRMGRGDVAVQRATMHAWRNPSETEWARMLFVLQDCQDVFVNGEKLGEDHGRGTEGVPPSGN